MARDRAHVTVDQMVRSFGGLQPRGAETRRSWYDWQERPETVSALTALAALHLVGPTGAMELLFGKGAAAAPQRDQGVGEALQRLSTLERHVSGLTDEASATGETLARIIDVLVKADLWDSRTGERRRDEKDEAASG
jgi:hypothetical protein